MSTVSASPLGALLSIGDAGLAGDEAEVETEVETVADAAWGGRRGFFLRVLQSSGWNPFVSMDLSMHALEAVSMEDADEEEGG